MTFLKKQEKSQIKNLTYHLKELEKEQQQQQKEQTQGGNLSPYGHFLF